MDPDSADVLFLDKVVLPVVMQDRFSGLDVQKTVGFPQSQFLTVVVAMPVEIPQLQFLDKVCIAVVVVWCRWPDSAENCGVFTVAVPGQGVHACFWSGADDQTVQKTVEFPQGAVLGQG